MRIRQTIQHNSGIPLGGIGTGSVEIRPDGLFHEWHIFNCGPWNPNSPACSDRPGMGPEDLLFMVRTRTPDGTVTVRYLGMREELLDLYNFAWARCVAGIEFDGRFPLATLTYIDPDLPVQVTAEVFSPFVALDSRTSGTPGFYVHFDVRNLTGEAVDVSILGITKNAAGHDQGSRVPVNKLHEVCGAEAVLLSAEGLDRNACSTGDMTFAAVGGEVSHITGSFAERYKASWFRYPKYGCKSLSLLHQFHRDGSLPNLNAERAPAVLKTVDPSEVPEQVHAGKIELDELMQQPMCREMYDRLSSVDPQEVKTDDFLQSLGTMIRYYLDRDDDWGWTALCTKLRVEPEAQQDSLFSVSWFFPNHVTPTGQNAGHQYEHWFASSLDVARFMLGDFTDIREKTLALPDAIHSSSLPDEVADAVTGQLSTLTKCTWWTKAGDFGVWEGYGCCGFHTTDITYQGSFPIVALFPDLQKRQMEMGARFQREDGRVHHFFRPDFTKVDDGFDRVDMNQQFVMLAARDYQWTGDKGYLERLWPHIVRAMDNTALLDSDGDGLPDTDTRRNTYDAWDFTGCPSYISSLWLGALKAGIRLACEMGDADQAAKWQAEYDKGLASFESKLWNGDYYVLYRDGDTLDECCMSDQMSGDWFASACGWGGILSPQRIRKALRSIVKHNFTKGLGLVNASYPPGKQRHMAAFSNPQAGAPWTGIEYTVGALLIEQGMLSEGLEIVRDIHHRYLRAGRFWNHVECGNHYYRAMSSWTVLIALSGFTWDEPSGVLKFDPALREPACLYPFFTSAAWGSYYQQTGVEGSGTAGIELTDGALTISELILPSAAGLMGGNVFLGERQIPARVKRLGDGVRVSFARPVEIKPPRPLRILAS